MSLLRYGSTSCPQCRASLVPPQLAHVRALLGAAPPRPRPAPQLAAADVPWEWGASDDSDAEADAEAGAASARARRGSDGGAVDGGSIVMALRMRAQHVSLLRAICAKGAPRLRTWAAGRRGTTAPPALTRVFISHHAPATHGPPLPSQCRWRCF